jgi:4-hydroxy-3-polyprenylbenzoate decarboxylase
MKLKNLQQLILEFEKIDELKRISVEVDPKLEITEITDRISKKDGPALLFENVKGSEYPLLINAFGSYKRMEYILDTDSLDDIAARIESLLKTAPPKNLREKIKILFTLKDVAGFIPKKVKKAPCQDIIKKDGDLLLDALPILTCWPDDGGPFITLPLVVTKDPDSGIQNLGMYRMQKYDNSSTGMHWQYNKDGAKHYKKFKEKGERMEVAVAIGGSPVVTYAATAPLPPDIDELILAGFLNNGAIDIVKAKTVDLFVPAESDFIIEGYIDPEDEKIEGPFGDHTGFYSPADIYPVFHVTCITSRKGAVYPATIVGKPPMEDCFMAKATERIFLPLMKLVAPEIVDIELPMEGVFHNCALISIDKEYSGHAKKVINLLWGLGQMASTKFIIIFDKDLNLRDSSTVVWKLLNNVDPKRDIIISDGPLDALDHSASYPNYGGKMGIDATRKTPEEGMGREWPEEIKMSDEIIERVNKRWSEFGL